ncbi:MAG: UrcA family protein, partial [Novosphingobium sp.]
MFIRPLIAPLMAGALLAATAPAMAQSAEGIQIQTADLNLDSAAGRTTLERRIGNAERQLCSGDLTTGSRVRLAQEQQACKAEVRRQVYA